MITITLKQYIDGGPETRRFKVKVPALPREGDYIDHEPSEINGYVQKSALFGWNEDGDAEIEVTVK